MLKRLSMDPVRSVVQIITTIKAFVDAPVIIGAHKFNDSRTFFLVPTIAKIDCGGAAGL